MRTLPSLALAAGALAAVLALTAACRSSAPSHASAASFADVARVLRHPRCLNCHPSGDRPRVGDDRRVHAMNVMRGRGGRGVPAMRCDSCHQDANQVGSGVPGAPHWHLAPRTMGWEGLDDRGLAEALKDPRRNGNRSLAELRAHMAEDALVLWGWDPGVGREPVPVPHAEFLADLDAWIAAGAPSPAPGVTSEFGGSPR